MSEEIQQQDNQQLQPETPTSNKRIAKNALMLYIRMFISMVVGLYTSRVVLATLGVEDYGIYGVVGGVVAMMGFLNASMSGATSRFLTFELGRGDQKRLAETFSSALIVHIGIALIVFVLAETVGLWFLCNKLVIPAERMNAAHWVYQCSILSAMLGITQAPYNASIIAHEKMDIYAYVEILNVTLKLLIVYLLVIGNFDKLKLYAVLVLAVSVLIMLIYRIYCISKFKETHFHWIWKKDIFKPILSFSSHTIFAHGSYSFRDQGNNFALNMIFGVIVNAAGGIAMTINGIISQFSNNIITAFRPQIIKLYSQKNYDNCNNLIILASKYSTLLLLLIIIPFEFEAPMIISLWLGKIPLFTVTFNRLMMLSLVAVVTAPVYIGLTATGDIKNYSIVQAFLYLLCPFIVYLFCSIIRRPEMAYVIVLIIQIITSLLVIYYYKRKNSFFKVNKYFKTLLIGVVIPSICSVGLCYIIFSSLESSFQRLFLIFMLNLFVIALMTFVVLSSKEKTYVIRYVKNNIKNKIKR